MSNRNEYGMITMTKQQYDDAIRDAAKLAIKLEREECAAIVDAAAEKSSGWGYEEEADRIREIAAAIRRQGQGEKG